MKPYNLLAIANAFIKSKKFKLAFLAAQAGALIYRGYKEKKIQRETDHQASVKH